MDWWSARKQKEEQIASSAIHLRQVLLTLHLTNTELLWKPKQSIANWFVSYKSSKILPKHISTIEAGISDFHKLVAIVLRMFNKKAKTESH